MGDSGSERLEDVIKRRLYGIDVKKRRAKKSASVSESNLSEIVSALEE